MKIWISCFLFFVFNLESQTHSLRIVTEDLPPYQIVANQKLVGGTSYELVISLMKASGIKAKFEVIPWARAYAIALREPDVLIFSIARTKSREEQFHWIWQLDTLKYHFYHLSVRKELTNIHNLTDLSKYTVVTVRNSVEAELLKEMGFEEDKNLILTLTYKDAWEMVALQRADFTYATFVSENISLTSIPLKKSDFTKSLNLNHSLGLYIAASKKTNGSLMEQLQSGILAVRQQQTSAQLKENRRN